MAWFLARLLSHSMLLADRKDRTQPSSPSSFPSLAFLYLSALLPCHHATRFLFAFLPLLPPLLPVGHPCGMAGQTGLAFLYYTHTFLPARLPAYCMRRRHTGAALRHCLLHPAPVGSYCLPTLPLFYMLSLPPSHLRLGPYLLLLSCLSLCLSCGGRTPPRPLLLLRYTTTSFSPSPVQLCPGWRQGQADREGRQTGMAHHAFCS